MLRMKSWGPCAHFAPELATWHMLMPRGAEPPCRPAQSGQFGAPFCSVGFGTLPGQPFLRGSPPPLSSTGERLLGGGQDRVLWFWPLPGSEQGLLKSPAGCDQEDAWWVSRKSCYCHQPPKGPWPLGAASSCWL